MLKTTLHRIGKVCKKEGSWKFFLRGFAENFKCFRFIPPKVTKSL